MSFIFKNFACVPRHVFHLFLVSLFRSLFITLVALGLHCCTRAFSSCGERGLLCAVVPGLLIPVVSLVQALGLQEFRHVGSTVSTPRLQGTASIVGAHRLSCSPTCGMFLDQGSNPCLLHWQSDSLSPSHQGSEPRDPL